jgi:hypothetical protein
MYTRTDFCILVRLTGEAVIFVSSYEDAISASFNDLIILRDAIGMRLLYL